MAVSRGTRKFIDHFDRAQVYTTTPGMNGWTIADTSAAGTPTYLNVTEDGGAAKLTLAADSEAEIVTFHQNDVLMLDAADLQHFWAIVKVAAIEAVTTLTMGVGSAQNDTADTVANHAWFRMEGSVSTTNLLVETDDGTNDNNDVATGTTLAAVYKKLHIDFTDGLASVKFFVDGARVARDTTFNMSDITAGNNLQPLIQIQKASGTGVPALTIAQIGWQYSYAYGA